MNKIMQAVTVTAVVMAAGAVIPAHADAMSGKSMDNTMMSMDANKDGMLSKTEVKSDKMMTAKFEKMDMNKDGMLDTSEMGDSSKPGTMDNNMPGQGKSPM